jgi:putative ABC transport system permease protein
MQADSTEYQQLRRRLLTSSSVQAVGAGVTPNPGNNRSNVQAVGSDVVHRDVYSEVVDVGWFEAMEITHPVVEAMRDAGPSAPERVLINQAAAERFGFDEPAGRELILGPNYDEPIPLTVSGVLPNMHFRPMRAPIQPTVFRVRAERNYAYGPVVRFAPGRTGDGLQHVRAVWNELRPETPLQTVYLDEQVASLYEQEQRFGALSAVLAGIAIVLAALGLASLVAYLTRLRMKEIGVRKAAFLVGAPGAWLIADWWLGQFAYRVDLSPLVFVGTGLGALAVAVAAVSVQALRAARVSPADVLRSE